MLPYFLLVMLLFVAACTEHGDPIADGLNEKSYGWHYRNLDTTRLYADSALRVARRRGYCDGMAEAYNNLAFVEMAAMRYDKAERYLDSVADITDNQLELLVADVQQMKLCQKRSRNQDFYAYSESAQRRINRIHNDTQSSKFKVQSSKRLTYAETEYYIVASAYYYYVGLYKRAAEMLQSIDPYGEIQRDTAQLLNYWYNIGAGGIIDDVQKEFGYLACTYDLATHYGYPYWEAQALQAMSEHLQDDSQRRRLIADNYPDIVYVNTDNMPDSLIAGNLAQRSLDIFRRYGDVYQTAGAYRTLAECYWHIGDNRSALICLNRALDTSPYDIDGNHKVQGSKFKVQSIKQAPDLVASIREDLCLVYSAANDKRNSDYNRNIYLDLQERTRQDRQLEARAAQLDTSVRWLNIMIVTVAVMIVLVTSLLVFFARMRRRSDSRFSITNLLKPLSLWQQRNATVNGQQKERYEEMLETADVVRLHIRQNRQRNLEQRAKVSLVVSILPLIDRMQNTISRLNSQLSTLNSQFSTTYIAELCDQINRDNDVLTQWIQMRQGELSLRIESFPLQDIFDIVAHSSTGFAMKGITLTVIPTDAVVKADKTLTLFMVNTIADNARKFTSEGGTVTIEARCAADPSGTSAAVEVSVTDNGPGMTPDTLSHIFDRTYTGGHGFGLKNCKGIIEKYKKTSSIFSVCDIGAESRCATDTAAQESGTRIFFRLPMGRVH